MNAFEEHIRKPFTRMITQGTTRKPGTAGIHSHPEAAPAKHGGGMAVDTCSHRQSLTT